MSATIAALVFWTCLTIVAWVYFGYPIALKIGLLGRREHFKGEDGAPSISVIIPAHNEESGIEAKLRNLLSLDYPRERMEILVGSDGSSDRTQQIVEQFAGEAVGLISFPQQQGKSAIQNGLVAVASGSILVFTDADCLLPPDAFRCLIQNFVDARVGLVTARPKYTNARDTATVQNEGLYLRYETWLRKQESQRGLLAMASGSLFAMRRSLWRPLERNLGDDFVLPLRVARAGMRNVYDERVAASTDLSQNNPEAMLRLKVRVISKDFRALLAHRALLNPFRHGAIAIGLWTHKLLRWFVPYFLLALFASNLSLLDARFFQIAFALQAAFYALAAAGLVLRGRVRGALWSVPMSFCVVNFAALLGTLKCLSGRTSGAWTPQREPRSSQAPSKRAHLPAESP
jgi:cellulose synthase/poly-beta-1,6-N-acetylglucosamine synthase-like glycosyltransferase